MGRRGSENLAAIRKRDIQPLQVMQSRSVTDAPTAKDFNALRGDIERIFQVLVSAGRA